MQRLLPSFSHRRPVAKAALPALAHHLVDRMKFRPCIDIHDGVVKQIVGGTLKDAAVAGGAETPVTNFVSTQPADHFARMYAADGLRGGHVILLGGGDASAQAGLLALAAFPGGMQVGGGITPANAPRFLAAGASHVIVTSYVFRDGRVDFGRLQELVDAVGRDRLVLDLSCRKRAKARSARSAAAKAAKEEAEAEAEAEDGNGRGAGVSSQGGMGGGDFEYVVVTDRWQRWTDTVVDGPTLRLLSSYCAEFLVHGVDVEGLRAGVDDGLVALLGEHCPSPVTYAGGVRDMADVARVAALGGGRVDVSVGSALDIFGGGFPYADLVRWHRAQQQQEQQQGQQGQQGQQQQEQEQQGQQGQQELEAAGSEAGAPRGGGGEVGAAAAGGGGGVGGLGGGGPGGGPPGVSGVDHEEADCRFVFRGATRADDAVLEYEVLLPAGGKAVAGGGSGGIGGRQGQGQGRGVGAPLAVLDIQSTRVPDAHRGKGVAGRLAAAAFAYAREKGMAVRPSCGYVSETYVPKHPEVADLLE